MRDIKVPVEKLREIVQQNRDNHRAIFDKVFGVYQERAETELARLMVDLKSGRNVRLMVTLPAPEDHTEDYDRVLRMLDLSVDTTIALSEEDVAQYVQDDWSWKRQWNATNASYGA